MITDEATLPRTNPFQGLDYFCEENRASFGGRDQDVSTVTSGILKSRTFLIYGRSGLGKTSLLKAGIIPELRTHGCKPVYVRTLVDPLNDLHCALAEQLGGERSHDLDQLIDDHDNDGPVVAVFDQFEEFFLRFPAGLRAESKQREAFLKTLNRLVHADRLNLRLVFALREEWLAEMQGLERFLPEILKASHRLHPLTAYGARQGILGAIHASGTAYDARLISDLVEELAKVNFDPTILQVLCFEVWKQADGRTRQGEAVRMVPTDIVGVGGIDGIFENYLKAVEGEISKDPGDATGIQVRAILDSLISRHQTNRATPYDKLLEGDCVVEPERLDWILDLLTRHRLVRRERRGEEDWYELVHERLIPILRDRLDSDKEYFPFRAAANLVDSTCRSSAWKTDPGNLLNETQLDRTVGPFRENLRFTDEQARFLLCSAIYNGSPNLAEWAAETDEETLVQEVRRYLDDEQDSGARYGAARAAGWMTVERPDFARRCRDLALEDPDDEVRKEAARSFARLAAPEDLEDLATRIPRRGASRTLKLLVAVVDHGLPEDHPFNLWQLFRARRKLRRERLDDRDARFLVRGRSRRGAITGAVGGLLMMVPGALLVWMANAEMLPELHSGVELALPITVGLLLLFTVPFCALVGFLAARREAQKVSLHKRERPPGSSLLSGPMMAVFGATILPLIAYQLAVLLGVAPAFSWWETMLDVKLFLISLAVLALGWPLLVLWVGGVEWLMRPMLFRLARRRWRLYLWMTLWAVGGSHFLSFLGWSTGDASQIFYIHWIARAATEGTLGFHVWFVAVAYGWCNMLFCLGPLMIFSGTLAIVRTSPAWGSDFPEELRLKQEDPPPTSAPRTIPGLRWVSALGGAFLTLATLVMVHRAVGFDSLPWIDEERILVVEGEALEITPTFHEGILDTDWLRLRIDSPAPLLARLEVEEALDVFQSGVGRVSSDHSLVLLPGSTRLGIQRHWQGIHSRAVQGAKIHLLPGIAGVEKDLALLPDTRRMVTVPLEFDPGEGVWRGTLRGHTPGGPGDEGRSLHLELIPRVLAASNPTEGGSYRWCLGHGFTLRVGARDSEEVQEIRCVTQMRDPDFRTLSAPQGIRGDFHLDLVLRRTNGEAGEAGEAASPPQDPTVYAFLRLGWLAPDPGTLEAEDCDPEDPLCADLLNDELDRVVSQIEWLGNTLDGLREDLGRVRRQAILDELVADFKLRIFELEHQQELSEDDREALQDLTEELAARRQTLGPRVDAVLAAQEEGTDLLPTVEALLARPSFQLEEARRRQAVADEITARQQQREEQQAKRRQLCQKLDCAPEGQEDLP